MHIALKMRKNVPVQVIGQVNANKDSGWGGVDAHVVGGVVQVLGPGIPLNVVRVVVPPPQLDIDPVLLGRAVVHYIPVKQKTH